MMVSVGTRWLGGFTEFYDTVNWGQYADRINWRRKLFELLSTR